MGSIGQLHLDSSISELRYLASRTTFSDSPLARMITVQTILVVPLCLLEIYFHNVLEYQVVCLLSHVSVLVLCLLFVFENCVRF